MIRVDRGPEPASLAQTRVVEIARVRHALLSGEPLSAALISDRYRPHREALHAAQRMKCCWCERLEILRNRDVEHYRPKASARGRDGVQREGWWWLAWSWHNLMFSCDRCNRAEKNDRFPLRDEQARLQPYQAPPGPERPLLLDPSSEDPMDHLQFKPLSSGDTEDWMIFPRGGSERGRWTIQTLGLNAMDLRDLYRRVVRDQLTSVLDLRDSIIAMRRAGELPPELHARWHRFARSAVAPTQYMASLRYDLYDYYFPPRLRLELALTLPRP